VSFDNAVTYKVFKTTWLTVAYNNSGTWQYNNAGTLTNASTNSLAGALSQSTAQTAYKWTKTNIEAMSDADWNASGGWTTSVTTLDWAKVLVSSDDTAYMSNMSADNAPSPLVASASTVHTTYAAWYAFDGASGTHWLATATTGWLKIDLGSNIIKTTYAIQALTGLQTRAPSAWTIEGSTNNSDWTTIDTRTGQSFSDWSSTFTIASPGSYRYYRLNVSANQGDASYLGLAEWKLYITGSAAPTFTKATINYDTNSGGVDSPNSTYIYDATNSLYRSGTITGLTTDVTTSQIDCSSWGDINSVAITQTTPTGTASNSAIYHAVSFDNAVTYKVFKTTWLTVAYNNSGTWQYNNAGTLTNASTNSLAGALSQSTAQSAYQWTKTNIEAMTDANWNETGGYTTSVTTTLDWAKVLVSGYDYTGDANGANNTSVAYATPVMTGFTSPSGVVATSGDYTTWYAWKVFDQNTTTDWYGTHSGTIWPAWISYDFGVGKQINKFRYFGANLYSPMDFTFAGSNNNTDWTTLYTGTNVADPGNAWTSYFTFSNSTSYRYYRFHITAKWQSAYVSIYELHMVERIKTEAAPTFTKATINYDTDVIALDLRSNSWEASVNDPTAAYCVLAVEPVDAITPNTDLLAYASIDNGAHYEQITLESTPFREIGAHDYIRGDLTGITARTDKTIRIKVTTANSKALKLHAWAIGVKY
jgi:hypothetical protein